MSKVIRLIFVLCLCIPVVAVSQTGTEIIKIADDAFEGQNYALAAKLYERFLEEQRKGVIEKVYAYELRGHVKKSKSKAEDSVKTISDADLKKAEVSFKLAESYRLNYQYENAEKAYDSLIVKYPGQFPTATYWYAISLMRNGKYQQAFQQLEKFMAEYPDKESGIYASADANTFNCFFALDTTTTRKGVNILPLDSLINKGRSNFAMNYFIDSNTVMFSTARPGTTGSEGDPARGNFYSDIFTAERAEGGFTNIKKLPPPLNSPLNEGPACLSLDRSTIFFTRWSSVNKEECAIYMSKTFNGQWLTPVRLNDLVNMAGFRSMHPSLSPDESILYFASDRQGTTGKLDLWAVTLDEQGQASNLVNLGTKINSVENDVTPFYHYESQTLYFSSEGHLGFGGLDIYKAFKSDTIWSTPKNLSRPYNSPRDESYFVLSKDEKSGFFSSDREKCGPCGEEYCLQAYEFKLDQGPPRYTVSGIVYDKDTKKVLKNSLVSLMDVKGDIETFFVTTDENGFYSTPLREEMEIYMKAQKKKYFGDAATISTIGLSASKDFVQDFYLKAIPEGELVIPGIEYDYDKATLRPESKKVVDELVEFLKLNDNIIIEISSHTDVRGNDAYNMKLSQERAKSVVNYLIFNGIDKNRLLAQGYGETRPLIPDAKTEDDHQHNRRTAFRILSEDFKPVSKLKTRVK